MRAAVCGLLSLFFATARAECNIRATPLRFGNYDAFSASPTLGTGSLYISCEDPKKRYTVRVEATPSDTGSYTRRVLRSSKGGELYYSMFTNPAMTAILDVQKRVVSKAAPWEIQLYGEIDPGQNVVVGRYSDRIQINIDW